MEWKNNAGNLVDYSVIRMMQEVYLVDCQQSKSIQCSRLVKDNTPVSPLAPQDMKRVAGAGRHLQGTQTLSSSELLSLTLHSQIILFLELYFHVFVQ